MKIKILDLIDFEKVDALLEGFNKTTGFVTAILDLDGKVLSKSGWRQICTEFHRINPETSKKCTFSDTELAGKMAEGQKYHFYKCLNGLVDVAVPIVINGEHIANLFSGQFFFEEPDRTFFIKQAGKYGFNEKKYLEALEKVPVVSKEKVLIAMDFLLNMTQLISETTFQKLEQTELNTIIRESEEKFKYVFESENVGKSITLPTGEINVNEAFSKMLGYTMEELKNKKWQDITPKDEIPIIQKKLDPMLKGEKDSAKFEKRYICKNGTLFWANVSVSCRYDDYGKPLYFITTIIDITDLKQAEQNSIASQAKLREALEASNQSRKTMLSVLEDQQHTQQEINKLNKELEQRVVQRTAQLELANKELEAFSYSVSHDLRAPLRHINGFVDMLTKDSHETLTKDSQHYLEIINSSALKMGTLIDDLLSFSRTGRAEIKESTFSMNQLVDESISQIKISTKDRKISWKIANLPQVHGDYSLLHLVWVNLIDNAVKYTRTRKKAVININYKEEKDEFIFSIRDNGVGFDMQYAQKLFGVFQRLHSTAEFEGTGIGLANVRRIILKHVGRTWAEAEVDKGATFYFSLPK